MSSITAQQLQLLLKKYKSDQRVAQELNVSRQTIYNLRKKYGIATITTNRKGRNIIIQEKAHHGVSPLALAQEYHLSLPHIYRIIRQTNQKSSLAFPPKKVVTLTQYQHFRATPVFTTITQFDAPLTPLSPHLLQMLLTQKEQSSTKVLLIRLISDNISLRTEYCQLYEHIKGVDFIVTLTPQEAATIEAEQ